MNVKSTEMNKSKSKSKSKKEFANNSHFYFRLIRIKQVCILFVTIIPYDANTELILTLLFHSIRNIFVSYFLYFGQSNENSYPWNYIKNP